MENFVETYLNGKGYNVNSKAQAVIKECDNWYANRVIEDFHERTTVHGTPYQLNRMGFAKRCCADDANLCEIAEVKICAISSFVMVQSGESKMSKTTLLWVAPGTIRRS